MPFELYIQMPKQISFLLEIKWNTEKNYIKKYKLIAYLLNPPTYQCADTLSVTDVW